MNEPIAIVFFPESPGILPAIIGTLYLTAGTALFSVPLGLAAGIYLTTQRGLRVGLRFRRNSQFNPTDVYFYPLTTN